MSAGASRALNVNHTGEAVHRHRPLADLLAGFAGKRVLVLGDVMLDEYIWGEVRRISPEAPVPVVEVRRRTSTCGGAANTAANVVGLGGQSLLLSVIGDDPQGAVLRQALTHAGVGQDGLCVDARRGTTVKSRIVAHNQQVVRLDTDSQLPLTGSLESALLDRAEVLLPAVDACIISDYAKGVVSPAVASRFIRMAHELGKPVVVDPKGTDYSKYRGASLVKPNLHEAERSARVEITDEETLAEAARRLLATLECSALLITRGADGMSLFRGDQPAVHIAALVRNVYDVTGAGDTVAGTLAMGLAAAGCLEDVVLLANHAAGVVVGKVGTAAITREELLAQVTTADTLPAS